MSASHQQQDPADSGRSTGAMQPVASQQPSDRYNLKNESLFDSTPSTDRQQPLSGELVEDAPSLTTEKESSFLRRAVVNPIGRGIDWMLDRIAADPNAEASFSKMVGKLGVDFIPWAGPIKKMADARAEAKTGDPEKIARGRTLFVIGVAEFLFDSGTGGASFFFPHEEAATGLRTIRDTMKRSRIFRSAAFLIPDVLTWGSALLMKSHFLRRNVDRLFLAGIDTEQVAKTTLPAPEKPGSPELPIDNSSSNAR